MLGIGFAHPEWLWALTLLPVLWLLRRWARKRRMAAVRDWSGEHAAEPMGIRAAGSQSLLALILLAAAGPTWGTETVRHEYQGRDLLVLLDVSRSMLAEDGVRQSRLMRAQARLDELLRMFEQEGHSERVALIAFTGRARTVSPFTFDYDHLRFALRRASPDLFRGEERLTQPTRGEPASGTSWSAAIGQAVRLLDLQPSSVGDVLLISDGDDEEAVSADLLAPLRDAGLKVHVLGVGNPVQASPIPSGQPDEPFLLMEEPGTHQRTKVLSRRRDDQLEKLAKLGGGALIHEDDGALVRWWNEKLRALPGRHSSGEPHSAAIPRFGWVIGLVLVTILLGLLPLGKLVRNPRGVALATLAFAVAGAGASQTSSVQRAQAAYERGDWAAALAAYSDSLPTTDDPGQISFNQAACLYQLGRWAEANDAYRRSLEDATGLRAALAWYGRGNSLAQLGSRRVGPGGVRLLEDALYAYSESDRAIAAWSNGEAMTVKHWSDAIQHNRLLVEALLQQKRQEPAPPGPSPADQQPSEDGSGEHGESQRDGQNNDRPRAPGARLPSEREIAPESGTGEGPKQPGAGDLPVVPEARDIPPLSKQEAEQVLQAALDRLQKVRRLQGAGPVVLPPNKRDW